MRSVFRLIVSALDFTDVVGLVGFSLLIYGVYCLHREAGFIVAGALLLIAAVASTRK